MDPIEHVLKRADVYIGSTRSREVEEFTVVDDQFHIEKRKIEVSPGLLRIFIEPLANCIDNFARSKQNNIKMTKISINIDNETGETTFWNDGYIIPVEIHPEEKCYNHSLIFGQLLTSSNYDDEEDRIDISGRNGIGVKAVSVFSSFFSVEGVDPVNKKHFKQIWKNNMKEVSDPIITATKLTKGYTKVNFIPDFSQFGIEGYTQDIINLFKKYVIDTAMITGLVVFFNDEQIPVNNLTDYSKLYGNENTETLRIKTDDCEIVLTTSNDFECISFANGIYTPLGGTHVDPWIELIFRPILQKLNKPKKPQLNISDIKKFFRIFVNATVKNPTFDSQSKLKLESPQIKAEVKKSHITAILKWPIIQQLEDIIRAKEMIVLKKSERKRRGHEKVEGLDSANFEGGKRGRECTLILVEGLSAKTYATDGIEIGVFGKKGRDFNGIMALRGKILNTRNATPASISKNAIVTDIIKALGLQYDLDYTLEENYNKLRYGKVLILTDQDSVTADTPVLLMDEKNNIIIRTIDNISSDWTCLNGKEYSSSSYKIWTENGWTNIKSVIRHKVKKNIYRILTHTGLVDVTEDHSLINDKNENISPKNIKVGTKLLHSFPKFKNNIIENIDIDILCKNELCKIASNLNIQCYQNYSKENLIIQIQKEQEQEYKFDCKNLDIISVDEAFVMGLFWSDGSCGIYKWTQTKKPKNRPNIYTLNRTSYSWAISNNDMDLLQKCENILNKIYPEHNFKIIENRNSFKKGNNKNYKLILNGGKKTSDFIQKWRNDFYDKNKNKKVPDWIYDCSQAVRQNFYDGVYAGDGNHSSPEKTHQIDIFGKIGAQGIFYLGKTLGYSVSINCRKDKPNVFRLTLTKHKQCKIRNKVKKIFCIGDTEQYVYDLETENHHFQAGIGELIVHNTDGYHISGLIQNLFHSLFPSLLKREQPFLTSMQTLIVRVYEGKKDILFYDENEYKNYILNNPDKKISKKYYKGLGASNKKDIAQTFGQKIVEFYEDEKTAEIMNKVFHTKFADQRKEWLEHFDPNKNVLKWNGNKKETIKVSHSDFLDIELIKFSISDCARSIPHLLDGLKESHRKVLYVAFIRNLKYSSNKMLKVSQFAGSVSEKSGYHHGENNLHGTIIGMAASYIGSNNIPLLFRGGQFGSRLAGGKDAADARYPSTKLDMLTRLIFRPEDDVLLDYLEDDGEKIEPKFYIPIIPMILVNGNLGIGTGWSSSVPCYNPLDLVNSIKVWLENDGKVITKDNNTIISLLPDIKPWYRDHTGEIIFDEEQKYVSWGKIIRNRNEVKVVELPVGMWTNDFKDYLEDLLEEKQISDYKNYSTPEIINFVVEENDDGLVCDENNLKLYKYIRTSNMVLFSETGQLKRYGTTDEIIDEFCQVRFKFYIKRKTYLLNQFEKEIKFLQNKRRFLEEVRDGEIKLFETNAKIRQSRKTADLVTELENRKYDKEIEKEDDKEDKNENEKEEDNEEKKITNKHGYEYLLRLQINSITAEKINKLKNDIDNLVKQYESLKNTSEKDLWLQDLNVFEKEYEKYLKILTNEKNYS